MCRRIALTELDGPAMGDDSAGAFGAAAESRESCRPPGGPRELEIWWRAGDGAHQGRRDGVDPGAAGSGRSTARAGRGAAERAAAGAAARDAPAARPPRDHVAALAADQLRESPARISPMRRSLILAALVVDLRLTARARVVAGAASAADPRLVAGWVIGQLQTPRVRVVRRFQYDETSGKCRDAEGREGYNRSSRAELETTGDAECGAIQPHIPSPLQCESAGSQLRGRALVPGRDHRL
jgi:hypothetical protein